MLSEHTATAALLLNFVCVCVHLYVLFQPVCQPRNCSINGMLAELCDRSKRAGGRRGRRRRTMAAWNKFEMQCNAMQLHVLCTARCNCGSRRRLQRSHLALRSFMKLPKHAHFLANSLDSPKRDTNKACCDVDLGLQAVRRSLSI